HRYSGMNWNDQTGKWKVDPKWPQTDSVGQEAYYIEYAIRGAVNQALVGHNLELIDELASFYLAYLNRFTTLGDLRARKSQLISTDLLDDQGVDSARTLAWLEKLGPDRVRARECTLCNSQFF